MGGYGLTKIALIGSGNIGTDLMVKVLRSTGPLELVAMAGIDPASEGLARARAAGIETTADGLEGLRRLPSYRDVSILLDATSAKAHQAHAPVLAADGKTVLDLTPAAIGPYVVPTVNLDSLVDRPNANMVTCGGQATIPIVAAMSSVAPVAYAEIVASIASRSAGPGTRANIDEFTRTTAHAIEVVGGARTAKAIIVLNPAEPPLIMRDTVYGLVESEDSDSIARSIEAMVAQVQSFVPGYRLKQGVQFEPFDGLLPGSTTPVKGLKVSVFLEVEGAGDYLPPYAGNLDIMTAAAVRAAEKLALAKGG